MIIFYRENWFDANVLQSPQASFNVPDLYAAIFSVSSLYKNQWLELFCFCQHGKINSWDNAAKH
jgi:hypothetical protein